MKLLSDHSPVDVHRGPTLSHAELIGRVRGKRALICLITDSVDAEVIDAGRDLAIIANVAVGFDNIDAAHARTRGIVVTNTPDVLTDAVADFTWALILALTRRVAEGDRLVRRGEWKGWAFDFMLGTELGGKVLGIIGFGRIGRAVAARAPAFGMGVATVTRTQGSSSTVPGVHVEEMALDRLLATSDVVSVHVPLSRETRHLIDQPALARMRRSAYLINTSRGPVIDEAALAWALKEGMLAGAALDVYENEPVVHRDLLGFDNVILAPHLASATTETRTRMAELAARNVIAVLQGAPPLTPVSL